MSSDKDQDGWIDINQAGRELYAQLGERLDGDALPWEPLPTDDVYCPQGIDA